MKLPPPMPFGGIERKAEVLVFHIDLSSYFIKLILYADLSECIFEVGLINIMATVVQFSFYSFFMLHYVIIVNLKKVMFK